MSESGRVHAEGTRAAREGRRRSANPYPADSENWMSWSEAFDAETIRLERNGTAGDRAGAEGPATRDTAPTETVCRSPNGDDWLLERDPSGTVVAIVHQANASSGGNRTRTPVDEFLERGGGGPEVVAVRAAVDG